MPLLPLGVGRRPSPRDELLSLSATCPLYKRKWCCPSTIIGLMLTGVAVAARHHGNHSTEETVIFQQAGRYGKPTVVLMGGGWRRRRTTNSGGEEKKKQSHVNLIRWGVFFIHSFISLRSTTTRNITLKVWKLISATREKTTTKVFEVVNQNYEIKKSLLL